MPGKLNEAINTQLATAFIERNDIYNRWGNAISSYQALPALRGFWPGSGVGPGASTATAGALVDQSGLSNHMPGTANPPFYFDNLMPIVRFDGSTQRFSITDAASNNGFDILGTEAYVQNVMRGITFGCWLYPDVAGAGSNRGLIVKGQGTAATTAYLSLLRSTNVIRTLVSDGATSDSDDSSDTVNHDAWNFYAGRYDITNTEVSTFLNGVKTSTAGSITNIQNTANDLSIAAYSSSVLWFDGQMSMIFICTGYLSDSIITGLFEQTRVLFGV